MDFTLFENTTSVSAIYKDSLPTFTKIEVAIRSAIVNIGCSITGNPFWMTDSANFVNLPKFHKTMNLINQELYKSGSAGFSVN